MYFNDLIIHDRIFWIYLIITLFFIIIGVTSLIVSNDPYILSIIILWILSNIALLITIYHASLNWYPEKLLYCKSDSQICETCFSGNKLIWILINVIFLVLLILAILCAGQFSDANPTILKSVSGIFILIGGLSLITIASHCKISGFSCFIIPFWSCVSYLIIWWGLTIYTII